MAIIGNILLCLATIIFFVILAAVYGKESHQSGDMAAGYPMGVILFFLAFLVVMLLAGVAIGWTGGFDWIGTGTTQRVLIAGLGIALPIVTAALSALFKYERAGVPWIFRIISDFAPALIPAVLIVCGFILVNQGIRQSVPEAAYKWPLMGVFGLGAIGVAAGIFSWMQESAHNAERRIQQNLADQDRYHLEHLKEIDTCDVHQYMSRILVFTDGNQDQEVRERAVAKVKTHPQWQQELVRLLEGDGASEAFDFLASNEVEDKSLFVKPVETGIRTTAEWVRRMIREASHEAHFYDDQFSWQVERVLRTVDKMEGMGHDYRPVVRELRAALDEPSEYKKVRFHCIDTLDRWIKKHQ